MIERPADPASRSVLQDSEPFRPLRRRLVDQFFLAARERIYAPGEVVIRQGQDAEALHVVAEGTADVILHDHGFARKIGSVIPGSVIGEMSLITEEPATADVVVAEVPLRTLVITASDFEALAGRNPELTIVLTNLVAERLGRALHDGLGGKELNGFRILSCVARGGMAVVYEALELASGRRVALKMMSHRLVFQPGAISRFEREARIVEPLEHPNIARLIGHFPAFRTEFIVMEFCEGANLGDLLTRFGAFPELEARRILGQLATALAFVHDRGVVHRDLKPGNVILTPQGQVKLTDFGLAKEQQTISEDDTTTTEASVLGTPLYMAPEQIIGDDSGVVMDVYAFACVAYELLAGRRLFEVRSMAQLLKDKQALVVPPPYEIGPGISPEMHRLLVAGLEKDPTKRLGSLKEAALWVGVPGGAFLDKLFRR
ncbi:MAG TPA: protein kinase [Candidatus Polarisedimenticolaceae bacterium]|nr:protein kinase [Candidatus Polarisedimenticolaceae bacterium]